MNPFNLRLSLLVLFSILLISKLPHIPQCTHTHAYNKHKYMCMYVYSCPTCCACWQRCKMRRRCLNRQTHTHARSHTDMPCQRQQQQVSEIERKVNERQKATAQLSRSFTHSHVRSVWLRMRESATGASRIKRARCACACECVCVCGALSLVFIWGLITLCGCGCHRLC